MLASYNTCRGAHQASNRPWPSQHAIRSSACRQMYCRTQASRGASAGSSTLTGLHDDVAQFGFSTGFSDAYEMGPYLGSGSFGTVHVAVKKATGERYAVKTITKKKLGGYLEQHFVRRVRHEMDLYHHMGRSLNVVQLFGAYEDDKNVDLVLQLCEGGSLWSRIKQGAYGEVDAARIIREILRAVAQCHARGVVVRDVKPENFLFLDRSPMSPLKMIDFGMATYCTPSQTLEDRAGTVYYCSPEMVRKKYGLKTDVWSAGVIAYELLAARLPFTNEDGGPLTNSLRLSRTHLSNRDVFSSILYAPLDFEGAPWSDISPAAKEFVQQLLDRNPDTRPSAAEALQHPWLALPEQDTMQDHGRQRLNDTLVQQLQRYGTYARLKQVCLSKVASFMTSYDPAALQQLRQLLGVGQAGGKIPYAKAVQVLTSGQFELSPVEVQQLLSSFNIDADGYMDVSEWLAALTDWQAVQDSEAWEGLLARAFDAIDSDHSGELSTEELESLLCDPEEGCVMEDTVPAAIREAQADLSVPEQSGNRKSASDQQSLVLDLTAFTRLLRTAQQDRLELFESRRTQPPTTDN